MIYPASLVKAARDCATVLRAYANGKKADILKFEAAKLEMEANAAERRYWAEKERAPEPEEMKVVRKSLAYVLAFIIGYGAAWAHDQWGSKNGKR